ncbi:hypothetical protein FRB96_000143 [Tulasnella sp. 330]|nr:hypothetical protein FRB96_000143 [Tulasnella sp. 330]KAG8885873.1 hypothetical protein FRB97_009035 [Tulasnella sp. 331]
MPSVRRQPLSELPLAFYVVTDKNEREHDSKATEITSPTKAKLLLSPPKRRILAAEGLASPSKSPARRLLFRSMADDMTPSNSLTGLLSAGGGGLDERSGNPSTSSHQPISSSSSCVSVGSSMTFVSSQTTAVSSPSKPSISSTALPGTPPNTRARTRSLAPSPELSENLVARESTPDPVSRPNALKRLRSGGSTGSSSLSANPPTPKRRHLALDGLSMEFSLNEDDEEPFNDKENVPPPRKKKVVLAKSGISVREVSLTPRAGKQRGGPSEYPTPEERRTRRAALEAEVNEPDQMDGY